MLKTKIELNSGIPKKLKKIITVMKIKKKL